MPLCCPFGAAFFCSLSADEIQCHRQCSATPVLELRACGGLVLLKQEPASQRIFVRSRFNHSCGCVMRSVPDPDGHSGIALEVTHPVRGATTAGEEVHRLAMPSEPDLDLVRLVRPPARCRQVAEWLLLGHEGNVLTFSRMRDGCLQRLIPVTPIPR